MNQQTRMVQVRQQVLKHNDVIARQLRQQFHDAGIFVISLVSSPGAGKTAFLQQVLSRASQHLKVAALVGDLATDNDAARLATSGAPVRQITTGTVCHLEAQMIKDALDGWTCNLPTIESSDHLVIESLSPMIQCSDDSMIYSSNLDILFIENVGNLVCPASYDLGEDMRLVLMSVTEGEDKPLKYPTIFNTADVAVITKMDLADAVAFDGDTCIANIHRVRPGMPILQVSAKTGAGMDQWDQLLQEHRQPASADIRFEGRPCLATDA